MLATNTPHDPLYIADEKVGKSNGGLFGDVIEEIDDVIGNIMSTLKRNKIENNTMIWFTSDNGPWFEGWNGGYRERKSHYFEGGTRVPCIVKWPSEYTNDNGHDDHNNKIYYNKDDFVVTHQDMFSTVLDVADIPEPSDRLLDGISLLKKENKTRSIHWHSGLHLATMRKGKYKIHFQHSILRDVELAYNRTLGLKEFDNRKHMWLNDLELDPHEAYDVTEKHRVIANLMADEAMQWEKQFRNNPRGWHLRN